jgi:hypothetical protein
MFVNASGRYEYSLQQTFHRCFLTSFSSFGYAASELKIFFFRIWPIRNKNCMWPPCLLTDQNEMSNRYRRPYVHASYQASVHLAKRFQRRRFLGNRPIRNKNCLWWPCLLTDQDEMSILYRGPTMMPPTKFRFIWQSGFWASEEKIFFRNQPIRNNNCLWWHVCWRNGTKWAIFIEDLP